MENHLKISEVKLAVEDNCIELRALVDEDIVYFRVPKDHEIYQIAEPFIGISLLEAMINDRTIVIEGLSISKGLFDRLNEIQKIYSSWNKDLKIIDIIAETTLEALPFNNVGSFFSAGVDSTHTLLRNIDEISHLIIFNIFDYGNDKDAWENRVKKQTEFAQSIDKILIPVETNARQWFQDRNISWLFAHGLFLSSVGGVFGLKRSYIPASHTYDELFPWGSHPMSDPMWSTESTEVIHHGAGYRRSEKMREILENKVLADNLQTCWMYTHKNCGECPKCARSILAIHLLDEETKSFPRYDKKSTLKLLKSRDESGVTYLEDTMLLAQNNNNPEIYKKLKSYYRQYQFKNIIFSIDRYFLNNSMRNIYRKIKRPNWLDLRVSLRGKTRWEI